MTKQTLRLCLDLNVFVADFLTRRAGREAGACGTLVDAAAGLTQAALTVQLVTSWGMLNRLSDVLVRLGASDDDAEAYARNLIVIAALGEEYEAPHLTLGGTGVAPLTDPEDRHVLETALAGRATVLATADIGGFRTRHATELVRGRHLVVKGSAGQRMHIAHPALAATWLRTGSIPKS